MRKNAVSGGRCLAVGNNIISDIARRCTVLSDHYYSNCFSNLLNTVRKHTNTRTRRCTHSHTHRHGQRLIKRLLFEWVFHNIVWTDLIFPILNKPGIYFRWLIWIWNYIDKTKELSILNVDFHTVTQSSTDAVNYRVFCFRTDAVPTDNMWRFSMM